MQERLPLRRVIGKGRSYDGNAMGIRSEHEVKESTSRSAKIGVEIRTGNVMGGMSSAETVEPSRGVGDDGGDSDKRGARSIRLGR